MWIACINIYQNDLLAWIYTVDEGYLMLTSNASPSTEFFVIFGIYAEHLCALPFDYISAQRVQR